MIKNKFIRKFFLIAFYSFITIIFFSFVFLYNLLIVKDIIYVDQNGKKGIEDGYYEIKYLERINQDHYVYPDTDRNSLMTEILLANEMKSAYIKSFHYELLKNGKPLPITAITPTNFLIDKDRNTDFDSVNRRVQDKKEILKSIYVIIDNLSFFDKELLLNYDIIISDLNNDYEIKGSVKLFRTTRRYFDF